MSDTVGHAGGTSTDRGTEPLVRRLSGTGTTPSVIGAVLSGAWITVTSPLILATVLLTTGILVFGELQAGVSEPVWTAVAAVARILPGLIVIGVAAARFAGKEASTSAVLGQVLGRLPSALGIVLVSFVIGVVLGLIGFLLGMLVGLLALIVIVPLSVFVLVRTALVFQVVIVDAVDPLDAFGLSWAGTAGNSIRVLTLLAVGSVGPVLPLVVELPAGTVGTVLGVLWTTVVWSVLLVALTTVWCRVRTEYVVGGDG